MMAVAVEKSGTVETVPPIGRGMTAVREVGLRIIGAALQIWATIAVVQVLAPSVAGIYFRGVVIAYGLAALLRGKYELYISQFLIDAQKSDVGAHARVVVRALGIRVLTRSAIACALLLVLTADLDVMDVYLRPYLQTYLPFVLAVPFATLALFLASALRAANRALGSVLVSSYSINLLIILAASATTAEWSDVPLVTLSWGFFIGCVLAAGMGVVLARRVFEVSKHTRRLKLDGVEWRHICSTTARHGLTGIALAALQWGPLCVLAIFGTAVEIAQYAVATRTAQIIDFLIPAVIFIPQSGRIQSRLCQAAHTMRGRLTVDLAVSLTTTSICVLAVAVLTPWFVGWYGLAYSGLMGLFALLFLTQWINGTARPALRRLAADLDMNRNRRIMLISMTIAIAVSLAGIHRYGPFAAAVGVLAGALALNGQAFASAFTRVAANDSI